MRERIELPGCFDLAICKMKVGVREAGRGRSTLSMEVYVAFLTSYKSTSFSTGPQELVNRTASNSKQISLSSSI